MREGGPEASSASPHPAPSPGGHGAPRLALLVLNLLLLLARTLGQTGTHTAMGSPGCRARPGPRKDGYDGLPGPKGVNQVSLLALVRGHLGPEGMTVHPGPTQGRQDSGLGVRRVVPLPTPTPTAEVCL